MQVDKKTIESHLSQKGFVKEDTHHKYFYHECDGIQTGAYTYTSHGSKYKTYGRELLGMMKKQLKLDTTQQVFDLVTCPMSEDAYNEILKKKGFIKSEDDMDKKAGR